MVACCQRLHSELEADFCRQMLGHCLMHAVHTKFVHLRAWCLTAVPYCLVRAVTQCMYLIVGMYTWQISNYTAWLSVNPKYIVSNEQHIWLQKH